MDKIITVYGDGNTGKTTVINEIYYFLIKNGATVVHKKKQIDGDQNDFTAVLSYKGKNIAFLSMGDYRTAVDKHVVKFKKHDIFITALNKRFATIGTVWLKNSNAIYKVDKTMANSMFLSSLKSYFLNSKKICLFEF